MTKKYTYFRVQSRPNVNSEMHKACKKYEEIIHNVGFEFVNLSLVGIMKTVDNI